MLPGVERVLLGAVPVPQRLRAAATAAPDCARASPARGHRAAAATSRLRLPSPWRWLPTPRRWIPRISAPAAGLPRISAPAAGLPTARILPGIAV